MSTGSYRFFLPLHVRFYETDLQGHVNFIWHHSYFAMAAAGYLRAIGFAIDHLAQLGYDLVFVDSHGSYLDGCTYDDLLHVHCRVERIGDTSIRFALETLDGEDGRRIAAGDLTAVLLDRTSGRKTSVPRAFREAVDRHESADPPA